MCINKIELKIYSGVNRLMALKKVALKKGNYKVALKKGNYSEETENIRLELESLFTQWLLQRNYLKPELTGF